MYHVEGGFLVRLFRIIEEGGFRADDDFSEKILIEGKGDAVGGGRVFKVVGVELSDFFLSNEIDRDLLTVNRFLLEQKLDEFCHRRNLDR